LECAGLLLLWLVMEDVCKFESGDHAALFSDNQPTVSWVQRRAAKSSEVAGQLIRGLSCRQKMMNVSPLTTLHVPGKQNAMTDIPSRSFGSEPKWHCKTDTDLLNLYNSPFPLPNQHSWTVYRPSNALFMRVCSVLRMKLITMEEWTRLPKPGKFSTNIGAPLSHLWEWTLNYRVLPTLKGSDASQVLQRQRDVYTMVEENKSKLAQCLGQSRPLARRSTWCMR